MKCEKEQQVVEATRNGLWTSALRAHVRDCALCTQTGLIAAALLENAAKLEQRLDQLSTVNASITDLAEVYGPPPGGKKQLSEDERKAAANALRVSGVK